MIEGSLVTISTTNQRRMFLIVALLAATVAHTKDDDSTARIPLHTVAPQYPALAKQMRVEGEVTVCFNVDRGGRTHRVKVRSSTNRIFEKPSVRAVRNSTYQPLAKHQQETGVKSCRTFRFSLSPVETPKN